MDYTDVWGVRVVNTTLHDITFRRSGIEDFLQTVPPSGTVINAVPFTDTIEVANGVSIVRTKYEGNPDGFKFLKDIPMDSSIIIIGSIIAALAYPGKVKSLIAWKGYKQLPPHERVYVYNKFRVFI